MAGGMSRICSPLPAKLITNAALMAWVSPVIYQMLDFSIAIKGMVKFNNCNDAPKTKPLF
jgi:hypothetical protein